MIIVFRNETHNVKLISVKQYFFACSTWMCCERGEGEKEVESQGRSRVKVSSQETDLKGQRSLRMRAKANQKRIVKQEIVEQFIVQDVRKTLTRLPIFLSPTLVLTSTLKLTSFGGYTNA